MVVESIEPLRDRNPPGRAPSPGAPFVPSGSAASPGSAQPSLLDQGANRLLNIAPFEGAGVGIGGRPLLDELHARTLIIRGQGEDLDGEALIGNRNSHGWLSVSEVVGNGAERGQPGHSRPVVAAFAPVCAASRAVLAPVLRSSWRKPED